MTEFTLHEAVSNVFDRTANGAIFTRDLKTIYSLMIICLNLTDQKHKPALNFMNKTSLHYRFSLQEAITVMGNLQLNIESSSTSTTLAYNIKPELARKLLKIFFSARLLHTPADRTRDEPKDKVLLQPTPKGVAVVQSYCKVNGVEYQSKVPIVSSSFNSMDLFIFERSSITGTVIYSEYFIHLLFARFLGPKPNVWNSTNLPDSIPSLEHRLLMDDEFDFCNYNIPNQASRPWRDSPNSANVSPEPSTSLKKPGVSKHRPKPIESPFHHNYFTNPESDSHVQYYVSNVGVRLYRDHSFANIKVKYCFNAKASWQWLMDCTDLMYPNEATEILNLFYKYGLIEPITLPPSTSTSNKKFAPLKTSFYAVSKKGWSISQWEGLQKPLYVSNGEDIGTAAQDIMSNNQTILSDNSSMEADSNSQTSLFNKTRDDLDIKTVLSDPGLRYLFRLYLEKEYCVENLDVYMDIRHFSKRMTILLGVLELGKKSAEGSSTVSQRRAIVKLINECLSSAYNIYTSYITIGAPYQLNIDHMLRERISNTILHISSPLSTHFEHSCYTPPSRPEPVYLRIQDATDEQCIRPDIDKGCDVSLVPGTVPQTTPRTLSHGDVGRDLSPIKSPTSEEITRSLNTLEKLYPLLEQVGQQILKMLEFDSFPKFVQSEASKDVLKQ